MAHVEAAGGDVRSDRRGILVSAAIASLVGGLCCLTPVVTVLLGLSSVAAANELGNVLYDGHRWIFRAAGLCALVLSLVIYFRRRGVCTLDDAKRQRNRILNTAVIAFVAAVGGYVLWTYFVVHWWGVFAGLPWRQYDESGAIPVGLVVLLAALVLYARAARRARRAAPP